MSPTISKGDIIYVSEISYAQSPPHRGEVIAFWGNAPLLKKTGKPPTTYLKRVVGLPGERVSFQNGQVCINGAVSPELIRFHYVPGGDIFTDESAATVVPAESYFVLGDDTKKSFDSRYWGCVSESDIRGRALMILWPPWRVGFIK